MSRCLLISNRLPVAFNAKLNEYTPSSGGLVSAIKGLDPARVGFHFLWMGILTDEFQNKETKETNLNQLNNFRSGEIPLKPILIEPELYQNYYNLYCNNVLWPLFHYETNKVQHNQTGLLAYREVNAKVAEEILQEANENDLIWVHDFQLLLVPGMIKKIRPELKVSFFLHIPFPSFEIFRELPEREEILLSLMSCDQLGFHDNSYLNHFKHTILHLAGDLTPDDSLWKSYPISIDTEHFMELSEEIKTQKFAQRYRENKKELKWILGVDRLDYIKGLTQKLKAYQEFLQQYPEQRGRVQLIQVVIPSRTEVKDYQKLKQNIEGLTSMINGEFGTLSWTPVIYFYHSICPHELSALYQLSDVLFISSKRDGMNLVSLEYVACQSAHSPGVILMSEFAGAHSTLSFSISINPWNIQDTALKIHQSLHQPINKRKTEMSAMKSFLLSRTSSDWAREILLDLKASYP